MKTLTCSDLGGSCDAKISGNSFQEIGEKCQAHVMEEIGKGDESHKEAVEKWKKMSQADMDTMLEGFEKKFEEAPSE